MHALPCVLAATRCVMRICGLCHASLVCCGLGTTLHRNCRVPCRAFEIIATCCLAVCAAMVSR